MGSDASIVHIPSDYMNHADFIIIRLKEVLYWVTNHIVQFLTFLKIKKFVPTYKANIPFAAGIKNTLHWFESEPIRMIINEETNKFLDGLIDNFGR